MTVAVACTRLVMLVASCAWFDSGYMQCVSLRSMSYSCIGELWILRSILDLLFFCVVLGSIADTCSASVNGVFHIRELVDYGS